ncbi:class I SAM-dependent methyltransferase [Streptomyces torulosus]|uniref:class I SAM-dependent methyltransferase n=1 Tax=Streptomyces torulosus TaxID=68276 RepID=UPI0006EB3781|nr:class I SAM-dependent methyltransferase [Streptomyces torulosus]
MGVSMETAEVWIDRWERQQQHYAVAREERFTVIADVVEHVTTDRTRPLLLDLGCGPGSMAARLAARLPTAEIVAVDMDPLLLELGRTHHANAARFVDAVVGEARWPDTLGLDRPLDAVVSTTALHYLSERTLLGTYRSLFTLLRPGGALVNGDHFALDDRRCSDLTAVVGRRCAERSRTREHEDWRSWWAAAAEDPELADLFAQREKRRAASGNHEGNDNGLPLASHVELLRAAGFAHITPVWQYGDSHVLVALKD